MSELKAILSGRIGARQAKSIARGDNKEELFRLLLDFDKRTSDNAAWALTHLPKEANAWLTEKQDALIDEAMRTSSTTKRRLIMNLLGRTVFERDSIRTDFLDFCFSKMLSSEPVGVKTLAIKLAHAQCAHYPELLDEFGATLQLLDAEQLPPALRCIRRRMLKINDE